MDNDKWIWEESGGLDLDEFKKDKPKEREEKNNVFLPSLDNSIKSNNENNEEENIDNSFDDLLSFISEKNNSDNSMVLDSTNYKKTAGNTQLDNDKLSWNKFSDFRDVKEEEKEILTPTKRLFTSNNGVSLHTEVISDIYKTKEELTSNDYEKAKEEYTKEQKEKKENALNNEETQNIILTSNGMSLSEYLYNRRKRPAVTKNKKADEIVNEKIKPWENELYIRGVKEKEKNQSKIDKVRKKISTPEKISVDSFEKNKIKPSKYEKQILKTLGITDKDLYNLVSPDSSLTELEKAKLVSVGYFGTKPLKGKQSYNKFATIGDLHYLYFLDKFKFATTFNLALAVGRSYQNARGTLHKLYTMGLVNKIPILNAPIMWSITNTGLAVINSNNSLPTDAQASPYALSERVYVNYIAACLYSNEINALNLDDFPYKGRHFQGEIIKGEELIPEADLLSSMYTSIGDLIPDIYTKDTYKGERFGLMYNKWETEWRQWERNDGKSDFEKEPKKEYRYVLFSNDPFTNKFLIPDLVVSRPRNKNGSPANIAIEVERQLKSEDDYVKKFRMYKADTRVYSKVVYITSLNRIAKRINEAAKRVDFDRFDIMPPMNKNGPTREISGWLMV